MARKLILGDRFKLTGKFLKSTGQIAGGEGQSTWTVQACPCELCASGRYVCSDEADSIPLPDEDPWMRHFAVSNVFRVGTLDSRNVV